MIYDITRTITPETSVWEGDTPFSVHRVLNLADGESVNLTTLTMSAHTGTHADAYFHFHAEGEFIGQMPLAPYIGKCRVVTLEKDSGEMTPDDFRYVDLVGGERLLIHTGMSELADEDWTRDIPYLSVELIEYLAELGYRLIGLDSPSVDAYDSVDLPCHHALRQYGIANLERVTLANVPDGDYELIALPLKLDLACGSPVRAILRMLE